MELIFQMVGFWLLCFAVSVGVLDGKELTEIFIEKNQKLNWRNIIRAFLLSPLAVFMIFIRFLMVT